MAEEPKKDISLEESKDKVIELRVSLIRKVTDNPNLEDKDFVNLTPEQKVDITNQMKKIIAENPEIYGKSSEIAEKLGDISKPEKFGAKEVVKSAVSGVSKGVDNIVETVKSGNRTLLIVSIIAGIGFAAWGLSSLTKVVPTNKS